MKNYRSLLLFAGFVFLVVSACATPQQSAMPTGNPEQLVNQLESDLAGARANKVDVLAPGLYNDAQTAFMKAKKSLEKGAKLSTIADYVAKGNASLDQAEEIAQVSRTILRDTNEARDKALKVNADRLGKPYTDVEEDYLKLTKAML